MRHIATFFILIAVFLSQSAIAQQREPFLSSSAPFTNGKLLTIGDNVISLPEMAFTMTTTIDNKAVTTRLKPLIL